MKDRHKKILKVVLLTVLPILIIAVLLSFLGTKLLSKSYALDEGMNNISAFVDQEDNPTSVSFVLEYLDHTSKENVDGNKVRITADDVILTFFDAKTNEEITPDDGVVTLSQTGTIVKINGIEKGNVYDINVKPIENRKGVMPAYKKAVIEVNYENNLTAYIKELRDNNNQEVELSDNDKMVFLFTDSEDKIKLRNNEDVEISYYYSLNELSEAELNNVDFVEYDKDTYLSVSTNGYLYAKSRYKTNGYSKINTLHITNIDKLEPVINVESVTLNATHDKATISYNISDQAATKEYGASGISRYAFSISSIVSDDEYKDALDDGHYTNTVEENGTYYIHAVDYAGNYYYIPYEVTEINPIELDPVILIISSTNTNLIGKEYYSLKSFHDDLLANGITSNDRVVAQIEHDIRNQYLDVENVNLTLDLNGYTINNTNNDQTIKVKEGASLKVIDDKIDLNKYFGPNADRCEPAGTSIDFSYTGEGQEYIIPSNGYYKFEVWGASGGKNNWGGSYIANYGYGGYASGIAEFNENDKVYVFVGQQGADGVRGAQAYTDLSFNGGGAGKGSSDNDDGGGAGGGATDIRLVNGNWDSLTSLASRIIVAGGGAGGATVQSNFTRRSAGSGGGLTGVGSSWRYSNAENANHTFNATQTTGYQFGIGDSGQTIGNAGGSGAGGGYYGGKKSTDSPSGGAGAGSGYVSGYTGCVAIKAEDDTSPKEGCSDNTTDNSCSIHYSGKKFINAKLINGLESMPDHATTGTIEGNDGNGYARITKQTCVFPPREVDPSKYPHGDGAGKIQNINNYSVKVENNATFEVGSDNSPDMAHIEYPDHTSPYLYGKDGGVFVAENATFNYYDGVVVGRIAVDGAVTDTPPLYDPSTIADENGYRMTLEKVTNIEALIGKTRYTLLESAIDAANKYKGTPNDQIEIDVVSDITKDFTIDIDNTKNIILDMNSFKLVNTVDEPLITNSGKLVLRDASGDNEFSKDKDQYVIYNKEGGNITIENGSYIRTNSSYPVVYNEHDAIMTINGGKFQTVTSIFGYGCREAIYNHGGTLIINGGEIKGTSCNYWGHRSGYGVTNADYNSDTLDTAASKTITTFNNYSQSYFDYGFTVNSDGYLESTNGLYPGSEAFAVVDLDTTGLPDGAKVKVKVTYEHKANASNCATINVHPYAVPDASGSCLYGTNGDTIAERDEYISGGKLYLHVREPIHRNATPTADTNKFIIKKVEIIPYITSQGRLIVNDGTFNQAYNCVNNQSKANSAFINGGTFGCDAAVINNSYGTITINDGEFNSVVSTNGFSRTYINDGTFTSINLDGANVYMSGGKTDGIHNSRPFNTRNDFKDYYTFNVTGGTIKNVENYFTLHITGATITGTFKNYSEVPIDVNNSTFEYQYQLPYPDEYYNILIDNLGDTTFNNVTINEEITTRNDWNNGGTFSTFIKNNESKLYLNNVTINEHGIAGNYMINSNTPDPVNRGIYNKGAGSIYTSGLKINQTANNVNYLSDGIYNTGTGSISFGTKDGVYHQNDSVISSLRYGVYSPSSNFNFYDGVIKGKDTASANVISDLETNYYLLNENDGTYDILKQTNVGPENILHVETGNKYSSLGEALSSVGDHATLKVIGDELYEVNSYNHTIKSTQNITLDLNGKKVTFGAGLVNNGNLIIIDNGTSIATVNTHQIINNNVMSITGGKWIHEFDSTSGILNNGNLTLNNVDVSIKEAHDNQAIYENNGTLTVDGVNTKITTDNYKYTKFFQNNYTGNLTINNGIYTVTTNTEYRKNLFGYVLYNEGGLVTINGGTFNIKSNNNDSGASYAFYGVPGTIPEFSNSTASDGVVPVGSNTYTKVDLSDYTGNVTIKVRYNKANTGESRFYLSSTEDNIFVETNIFKKTSELKKNDTISTTVQGGSAYYFGYSGDSAEIRDIIISQNNNEESLFHRGLITINNITVNESGNCASFYMLNSDITMNDGSITRSDDTKSGNGIYLLKGANGRFLGGTITNKVIPIRLYDYSYSYIDGLTITNNYTAGDFTGLYVEAGFVDIDNITITSKSYEANYGIKIYNNSVVNMNGGSIDLSGGRSLFGVRLGDDYSNNSYTFNMNNSSIYVHTVETPGYNYGDTDTYGIYPEHGAIVNIGNSSVIAESANKSYGIMAPGDKAPTITLSNNDDAVSEVTPVISGNTYGIYRQAGVLNYYDGIIKGNTQIFGGVTDRPELYELVYGTDGTLNTVILKKTVLVLNTDTNTEYSSIQAAITACPDNSTCNLKLLYKAALPSQVTIPATKNIVFNLNNLKITTSNNLNFVNNGSIKFTSGTLDSEGTQDYSGIIENNGTLTIDGVTVTDYDSTRSNLITNNSTGKVYIVSGTFKNNGTSAWQNEYSVKGTLIKNLGGYVEITNATMEAKSNNSYGITNGIYTTAVLPEGIVTNYGSYTTDYNQITVEYSNWTEIAIPVDLSSYTGNVNVGFKASPSGTNYSLKAWITTTSSEPASTETPVVNDSTDKNRTTTYSYSKPVTGGSKYYLHIRTINNVSINSITIEQNGDVVDLFKHGKVVINNIDYKDSGNDTMLLSENGIVEINGGTFTSTNDDNKGTGIKGKSGSTINITNGTINNRTYGIVLEGGSTLNTTGGTISVTKGTLYGVNASSGYVNANNLTINAASTAGYEQMGILSYNFSDVNVNYSTITIDNKGKTRGIYADNYSKVNVFNSTITVSGNSDTMGVYAQSSEPFTVGNSTITSNYHGIYSSDNARSIINISNNDGDDDSHVSTTTPLIEGKETALHGKDATFNFYDGKLKGTVVYTNGVNDVPEGYVVDKTTDGDYKVWTLTKSNIVLNVNNNTEYNNLQDAITACPDNTICTLKPLRDFYIYDDTSINDKKIIIFDLDTKTVYSKDDKYIVNNGNLTIKNGTMKNSVGINQHPIIDNNNTLVLENTATLDSDGFIYSRLITNNKKAKLYINGATLSNAEVQDSYHGTKVNGKSIYNNGGYIELNGAVFNTTSQNVSIYSTSDPDMPTKHSGNFTLKNTNGSIENTSGGNYYIPIDLTNYSGNVNITVNYSTSNNTTYKYYITTSNELPTTLTTVDHTENAIVNNKTFAKDVTGGTIYYLHVLASNASRLNDIKVTSGSTSESVLNRGKIVINDVTANYDGTGSFIYAENTEVLFEDGIIQQTSGINGTGISLANVSDLTINKLTISNKNTGITSNGHSKIVINDLTYSCGAGKDHTGLSLTDSIVTINDLDLDINATENSNTGIYTGGSTKLTINKADIQVYSPEYGRGLDIQGSSNVIIKNNTIIKTETTSTGKNGLYGITMGSQYATVTIGVDDGIVSTSKPEIYGRTSGIRKENGTFNFYDGIFKSPKEPIYGQANVPTGYQVILNGDESYLVIESHLDNTFSYNNQYFQSLDTILNVISQQTNKTGTIKVNNDAPIISTVVIPSDVSITLALEGHSLTFDDLSVGIINNGSLTIVDDVDGEYDEGDTSSLENANGTVIDNQGTLVLGATGMSGSNSPIIRGKTAITGNSYTRNTGQVISTDSGLSGIGKAIIRFFKSLIQPTYAYKTNDYQVNNLDDDVVLVDSPNIKAEQDLTKWTNMNINVGMTAHNYGVLNIVSSIDESQQKTLSYTVELYKDNELDDIVVESTSVQVLSNNKIKVNKEFFNNIHTKYDGYNINKVLLNGTELTIKNNTIAIDSEVDDGTVIKIYYKKKPKNIPTSKIITKTVPTEPITDETPTEPTTEETTTSSSRTTTTTEEVKGDVVIVVKNDFPWWIVIAAAILLALIGLLIWLLPILLRKSVLIAISGSVGSAVAAKLLQERQCKVTALFINTGTNLQQLTYAKQVCSKLGIDLYEQEINGEYRTRLLEGITNNPNTDLDKIYNKYILIDMLKDVAKEQHIKYISTGIYARKSNGKIIPGVNQVFDESDKLSLLTEDDIKKLLLPLGEIEYQEITQIAESNNVNFNNQKQSAMDKIGNNNIPSEVMDKLNK